MLNLPLQRRLLGLNAAAFTPLHGNGSLHLDAIPPLVDQLQRDGVAGLYVLGSTGEGTSFSTQERMVAADAFVESARGRLKTVVQVGHNSLAEARQLAEHSQEIGADAISAMAPSYFKPASARALVESLAEVASGAPELPFYYYHIPVMTGVDPDLEEFLQIAADRLPTFAGIKFSNTRLQDLQLCHEFHGGACDTVFGVDEMLLGAVAYGIGGAVGSTYNFAAPLYLRMLEAFHRGDLEQARIEQARSAALVRVILGHCGPSGLKAMMPLVGLDCGPHRLPQATADPRDVARMQTALERIGFFEWGRSRAAAPVKRRSVVA